MHRISPIISCILVAVLLCGCYYSESPLSKQGVFKIDKSLQGLWFDRDGKTVIKIISKGSDYYSIFVYFNNNNPIPVELSAFPTTIDGQTFLNLKIIKSNESLISPKWNAYFFCKYIKSNDGNKLKIYELNSHLVPENISSKDLYSFISHHINSSLLFDKDVIVFNRL